MCAKVAHLSGTGACIDKSYRDMDESTTLDPNGVSAEMLEHAIFELQAAGRPITVWVARSIYFFFHIQTKLRQELSNIY